MINKIGTHININPDEEWRYDRLENLIGNINYHYISTPILSFGDDKGRLIVYWLYRPKKKDRELIENLWKTMFCEVFVQHLYIDGEVVESKDE